jgi:ABC-type uncharacterized transport system substrate-binding protein
MLSKELIQELKDAGFPIQTAVRIVSQTGPAAVILAQQTTTVPIVFTTVTDAIAIGLVPNLSHPAGNLTGFTSWHPEIWLKAPSGR